jgi:hypothetical protein
MPLAELDLSPWSGLPRSLLSLRSTHFGIFFPQGNSENAISRTFFTILMIFATPNLRRRRGRDAGSPL